MATVIFAYWKMAAILKPALVSIALHVVKEYWNLAGSTCTSPVCVGTEAKLIASYGEIVIIKIIITNCAPLSAIADL